MSIGVGAAFMVKAAVLATALLFAGCAFRVASGRPITVTFKQVSCGAELNIVQEGLPTAIPPEACCLGWQESRTLLAKLVEADVPDQEGHHPHLRTDERMSGTVRATAPSEAEQAVAAIVLAFSTDPAARWTFPDPHQYLAHFPEIVRAFGGKAFAHGTGYHVSGFGGAALWLPPGIRPDEDALAAVLKSSVAVERQAAVFTVFEQMGRHHPHEPHWYLPLIGVDPVYQRKGYGAALLQHALGQCDRDHAAAYLESSNPANIPLYERHGFRVLATIQVESSPPITPMLRTAR